MAGTRTTTGTNTTYRFQWTAATARIDAIADGAARWFWRHGAGNHGTDDAPITYDSLSITEKVAILDAHIAQVMTDAATAEKSVADQESARLAADQYSKDNYRLG